ncbi:MAG: hypothetical protein JWO53_820 [Chlamydiia bacterium]|nr:hypothetical protein [Chlamydiia bacterium]
MLFYPQRISSFVYVSFLFAYFSAEIAFSCGFPVDDLLVLEDNFFVYSLEKGSEHLKVIT